MKRIFNNRTVQELPWHQNDNTTMIYTHVLKRGASDVTDLVRPRRTVDRVPRVPRRHALGARVGRSGMANSLGGGGLGLRDDKR